MKNNYHEMKLFWDRIGMGLSGLCLIHCLLLPFLAAALPWVEDERFHLAIAALAVPVAFFSFLPAFRRHGNRLILGVGLTGVLCLIVGALAHEQLGEEWEHKVTILGGLCLISAHFYNFRCCSRELCTHHAG